MTGKKHDPSEGIYYELGSSGNKAIREGGRIELKTLWKPCFVFQTSLIKKKFVLRFCYFKSINFSIFVLVDLNPRTRLQTDRER